MLRGRYVPLSCRDAVPSLSCRLSSRLSSGVYLSRGELWCLWASLRARINIPPEGEGVQSVHRSVVVPLRGVLQRGDLPLHHRGDASVCTAVYKGVLRGRVRMCGVYLRFRMHAEVRSCRGRHDSGTYSGTYSSAYSCTYSSTYRMQPLHHSGVVPLRGLLQYGNLPLHDSRHESLHRRTTVHLWVLQTRVRLRGIPLRRVHPCVRAYRGLHDSSTHTDGTLHHIL